MRQDLVDSEGKNTGKKAPAFCGGCPAAEHCNGPLFERNVRLVQVEEREKPTYDSFFSDDDHIPSFAYGVEEGEDGIYIPADPPVTHTERGTNPDSLSAELLQKVS